MMRIQVLIAGLMLGISSLAGQNLPVKVVGREAPMSRFRLSPDVKVYPVTKSVARAYYTGGYFLVSFDTYPSSPWNLYDSEGNLLWADFEQFWDAAYVPGAEDKPVFENGLAMTKWGTIINTSGQTVARVPDNADKVWPYFSDGLVTAFVKDIGSNPFRVYLNQEGKMVYPHLKQEVEIGARLMSPGELRCERRAFYDYALQKWGYLDSEGNIVIKPAFSAAHAFREDLAAVKDDKGMWGFIGKDGQYVIEPMFTIEPGDFYSGYSVVTKQNGKQTLFSKDGRVFGGDYSRVSIFVGHFCIGEKTRYGECVLIHDEKGPVYTLNGLGIEGLYEPDTKIPFIADNHGIYGQTTKAILQGRPIYPQYYLGDGYFFANSDISALGLMEGYARGMIYDYTGRVIIYFKEDDKDRF